jgi:tetratricopeptide (TPR) repeat protein
VEFVTVFLMASDMAGIPVEPVELLKNASGTAQEHVRIGVRNDATGAIEGNVDLATGKAGANASGELWARMSRLDFLSYYYMTRGVRESRWDDVRLAYRMNPGNYFVLYNMAAFAFREGEARAAQKQANKAKTMYDDALSYLTSSIASYPNYQPAHDGLQQVQQRLKTLASR